MEPLPHIMLEFYFNSVTRMDFFDPLWDDGHPWYPFGGTFIVQHGRDTSDLFRVYIESPFPGKGCMPLRHPEHGWLMPKMTAIEFARKNQP